MNLNDFSQLNKDRCESKRGFGHQLNSWSLSDWLLATLGELGEAANIVKKLNRVRDNIKGNKETYEELQEKLEQELADTFIYLNLTMQAAGFSPEVIVRKTFNNKSKEIGFTKLL